MFCMKCGAKIADGAAFCQACGNPVGAVDASAQSQPTQNIKPNEPMETKSINVSSNDESAFIGFYEDFGWTFISNQEVNIKDSHLERSGDTIYNVTESQHYVKLTFRRPVNVAPELKKLENDFWTAYYDFLSEPSKPHDGPVKFAGICILIGILCTSCGSIKISSSPEMAIGTGILLLIIGFIIIAFNLKQYEKYNKEMKQWKIDNMKFQEERGNIMEHCLIEARKYLI